MLRRRVGRADRTRRCVQLKDKVEILRRVELLVHVHNVRMVHLAQNRNLAQSCLACAPGPAARAPRPRTSVSIISSLPSHSFLSMILMATGLCVSFCVAARTTEKFPLQPRMRPAPPRFAQHKGAPSRGETVPPELLAHLVPLLEVGLRVARPILGQCIPNGLHGAPRCRDAHERSLGSRSWSVRPHSPSAVRSVGARAARRATGAGEQHGGRHVSKAVCACVRVCVCCPCVCVCARIGTRPSHGARRPIGQAAAAAARPIDPCAAAAAQLHRSPAFAAAAGRGQRPSVRARGLDRRSCERDGRSAVRLSPAVSCCERPGAWLMRDRIIVTVVVVNNSGSIAPAVVSTSAWSHHESRSPSPSRYARHLERPSLQQCRDVVVHHQHDGAAGPKPQNLPATHPGDR